MRFIVYGVGAIGGTIAASLALAGESVVGIARGAQLDAIAKDGLLFRTPAGDQRVNFPCYADPGAVGLTPDDVVLLTMKSQDTAGALAALRDAGATTQPIVCAQNGVANERVALRLFPNVYGMTVMVPGTFVTPGEIACHGTPKHGLLDIGRYPTGEDDVAAAIAAALTRAQFDVRVLPDVMRSKHGKLLENQRNVMEAALGPNADDKRFRAPLEAEAKAVYRTAGIEWIDIMPAYADRRRGVSDLGEIAGVARAGGSSTQSLRRGTGSIETDYLNGEIVLLGRLHGVPTPMNAALCALGSRLVREGLPPGSLTPDALAALLPGNI